MQNVDCCKALLPSVFPSNTQTQRQVNVHAEPQTHSWVEASRGVNIVRIWFWLKTCLIQILRLYFSLSYLLTHTNVNTHTFTDTQNLQLRLAEVHHGNKQRYHSLLFWDNYLGGKITGPFLDFFSVCQLSHRFDSLWNFHQRAFEQDSVVPDCLHCVCPFSASFFIRQGSNMTLNCVYVTGLMLLTLMKVRQQDQNGMLGFVRFCLLDFRCYNLCRQEVSRCKAVSSKLWYLWYVFLLQHKSNGLIVCWFIIIHW